MRFLENSDGKLVGCEKIEHVGKGKYKTILDSRWQLIPPFFRITRQKQRNVEPFPLAGPLTSFYASCCLDTSGRHSGAPKTLPPGPPTAT